MNKREQFFYDHAGYAYDPKTQTPEQGRQECAAQLAAAESWADEQDITFEWSIDPDIDSSEFDPDGERYALWQCIAVDSRAEVVAAVGGVDFGRNGDPWDEPYMHVVEAELALEARQESQAA